MASRGERGLEELKEVTVYRRKEKRKEGRILRETTRK